VENVRRPLRTHDLDRRMALTRSGSVLSPTTRMLSIILARRFLDKKQKHEVMTCAAEASVNRGALQMGGLARRLRLNNGPARSPEVGSL